MQLQISVAGINLDVLLPALVQRGEGFILSTLRLHNPSC